MKTTMARTMLTTGASLSILAVYFFITGEKELQIITIFQTIWANIVINLGIFLRYKFEIKNVILDYIIDVTYITLVLIVFGAVFDWYSKVPVWLLAAMAVGIYAFVIITSVIKINKDTKEINDLLQKRKEKEAAGVNRI